MNPGAPPPGGWQNGGGAPQGQGAPQGYAPPQGYGPPQGAMPNAMPGTRGALGPGVNRFDRAQGSLANAGGMLQSMQKGFTIFGGILAALGVVMIFVVGVGAGVGLLITGATMVAVARFMLPQFMGQVAGASALVGSLQAKEQVALTGIPTTARVLGMQQTGMIVNMNPQVAATLEVRGSQGPYQVQTLAVIPQMNIPQFQPGATVNVRVNPANPHDIAVVF